LNSKKILYQERLWEQLLIFIERGDVVPIIGRDILTLDLGEGPVPLQAILARDLAGECEIDVAGLSSTNPLNDVICRYLEKNGDHDELYGTVHELLRRRCPLPTPASLRKLAEIDRFNLFVTTTFDGLMAQAVNEKWYGGSQGTNEIAYRMDRIEDLPTDFPSDHQHIVYQILGRSSVIPNDYALNEEDTLEFIHCLQSPNRQPRRLFDELRRRNLLIIGNGFSDWLALFFLRIARGNRLWVAKEKKAYLVETCLSPDSRLISFLEHFNRETKVFPPTSAEVFVDELSERWAKHDRIKSNHDGPALIPDDLRGAIFISYASEDRKAAEKIATKLEQAGIRTWFDKKQLELGDNWERKIERNLTECSYFMPLVSKHCLTSKRRFFWAEWNLATKERQRAGPVDIFILPILLDDIDPQNSRLPVWASSTHAIRLDNENYEQILEVTIKLYRDYQRAIRPT
jgi:hypothetical protein